MCWSVISTMCISIISGCNTFIMLRFLQHLKMSHHNGYIVLCGYSGVLLLVSAGLIAAQSDQPTTISLAEKILLKIGDNIKI